MRTWDEMDVIRKTPCIHCGQVAHERSCLVEMKRKAEATMVAWGDHVSSIAAEAHTTLKVACKRLGVEVKKREDALRMSRAILDEALNSGDGSYHP